MAYITLEGEQVNEYLIMLKHNYTSSRNRDFVGTWTVAIESDSRVYAITVNFQLFLCE